MKEADYIDATDLAKLRMARDAVAATFSKSRQVVLIELDKAIELLEQHMDRIMETE